MKNSVNSIQFDWLEWRNDDFLLHLNRSFNCLCRNESNDVITFYWVSKTIGDCIRVVIDDELRGSEHKWYLRFSMHFSCSRSAIEGRWLVYVECVSKNLRSSITCAYIYVCVCVRARFYAFTFSELFVFFSTNQFKDEISSVLSHHRISIVILEMQIFY